MNLKTNTNADAVHALKTGRTPWRWMKRAVWAFVFLIAAVAVAGMVYQHFATKADERRFPPPGKLVDVGGHRLHIYGIGEQGPVVIMDAGLGGSSLAWRSVQTAIGQFARTYAYDRAGYGWSDTGPKPRSSEQIVRELRALLNNSGLEPPYIFVGHSMGGLHLRMFACLYPGEVAGLVLVESAHETQEDRVRSQFPEANPFHMSAIATVLLSSARFGLPRLMMTYVSSQKGTNAETHALEVAMMSRTPSFDAMWAEWTAMPKSFAEMRAMHRHLGDVPLVVVSRGKRGRSPMPGVPDVESSDRIWTEVQEELTKISSRGKRVIAQKSGHDIMNDEPEVVIDAVRSVVSESRLSAGTKEGKTEAANP